jgi:hypothetical protein
MNFKRKEILMSKTGMILAAFVLAFTVGIGLAIFAAPETQAKPIVCKLAVEPFYYCEPHPSCHGPGEQRCWECQGVDLSGEPCLCARVGCMVPPE